MHENCPSCGRPDGAGHTSKCTRDGKPTLAETVEALDALLAQCLGNPAVKAMLPRGILNKAINVNQAHKGAKN